VQQTPGALAAPMVDMEARVSSLSDPAGSDQPPDLSRQFEIDDLLARVDGLQAPPPPPAESQVFPVTPDEFRQLWDRAQAMAAFGLSALWELQAAADDTEGSLDAGVLLYSAHEYLAPAQLPPLPDLKPDQAEHAVRMLLTLDTESRRGGRPRRFPTRAVFITAIQEMYTKVDGQGWRHLLGTADDKQLADWLDCGATTLYQALRDWEITLEDIRRRRV